EWRGAEPGGDRGPVSIAAHRDADADARRRGGQEDPHHRPGEGDHPEAADWADPLLEHADATAEEGHHREPDPDQLARLAVLAFLGWGAEPAHELFQELAGFGV